MAKDDYEKEQKEKEDKLLDAYLGLSLSPHFEAVITDLKEYAGVNQLSVGPAELSLGVNAAYAIGIREGQKSALLYLDEMLKKAKDNV